MLPHSWHVQLSRALTLATHCFAGYLFLSKSRLGTPPRQFGLVSPWYFPRFARDIFFRASGVQRLWPRGAPVERVSTPCRTSHSRTLLAETPISFPIFVVLLPLSYSRLRNSASSKIGLWNSPGLRSWTPAFFRYRVIVLAGTFTLLLIWRVVIPPLYISASFLISTLCFKFSLLALVVERSAYF